MCGRVYSEVDNELEARIRNGIQTYMVFVQSPTRLIMRWCVREGVRAGVRSFGGSRSGIVWEALISFSFCVLVWHDKNMY